jgi:RimJ/RimL family protein N-acetyltransferase
VSVDLPPGAPAVSEHPVLRVDDLVLRAPTGADVTAIAAAIDDADIPRWIDVIPWPYTEEHARTFVTDIAGPAWVDGSGRTWLITDGSGDVVGAIGLHPRLAGVHELGFWLSRGARGRGIATRAGRTVCRFGFDELDVQRIEWQAVVGNDASRAVARRVGFVEEGVLRGRLRQNGRAADCWIAGLLPADLAAAEGGYL